MQEATPSYGSSEIISFKSISLLGPRRV